MIGPRVKSKKSEVPSDDVKVTILTVARKHFALFGLQGASLKDIANEAGVAGSLINYHFTDKEGLFKACAEHLAGDQLQKINRLLGEARNKDEFRVRIEIFAEEVILSVLSDPYGFEMIEREVKLGNKTVIAVFQDSLLSCFQAVVSFFESARKNGVIRDELDPFILAGILMNSTCDACRKDHLGKTFFNVSFEQTEYRKKFVSHIVSLFMNGVINEK